MEFFLATFFIFLIFLLLVVVRVCLAPIKFLFNIGRYNAILSTSRQHADLEPANFQSWREATRLFRTFPSNRLKLLKRGVVISVLTTKQDEHAFYVLLSQRFRYQFGELTVERRWSVIADIFGFGDDEFIFTRLRKEVSGRLPTYGAVTKVEGRVLPYMSERSLLPLPAMVKPFFLVRPKDHNSAPLPAYIKDLQECHSAEKGWVEVYDGRLLYSRLDRSRRVSFSTRFDGSASNAPSLEEDFLAFCSEALEILSTLETHAIIHNLGLQIEIMKQSERSSH